MNTLHFKYAIEVERSGSISQAADNLFMAQPNLSKAIKELEDTLGITIFKRTSKGAVPTQKGAKFLTYAKNIIAQLDQMETLSHSEDTLRQSMSISIPRGSYIASGLTKFIQELDTCKEIDINIQETNSMQTIRNITDGPFNLGIIRYQTNYENYFLDYLANKDLNYELIWEFEYLTVMSKNHPLASEKEIFINALSDYIEIIHGDSVVPYLNSPEVKGSAKKSLPKKRIYLYERCNQFDLLTNIPSTYMWVSPIPEEFLKRYDLIQRKCKTAKYRFKDILIYPKGYKFTPLDKKLVDKLYESKNRVAFQEYY